MVSLLYLKHAFNESDESVCGRWSENVVWQLFSGMDYCQSKLPCDATQIGRFRRVLGEAGVEQLLKTTIETALAVKPAEFERVIVDPTVQEKAIAHPTDSRLPEVAREKIVRRAQRAGLKLKITHEREGRTLRRRVGDYAHAKQFNRLRLVLRRQRTIFRIEAGESVAVVGASGAGKTTLLKIALGLLKPTEGEVLYGGQRIQHIGVQNFRRQIGTVMQEDVLLTGSLADNIAFFDVQPDRERVQACAQMAQLHDDICRMPMGYETLVGDLGSGLSGGQKQRLLLARALYKQPRVLALDEATSHLDLANERAVTAAIAYMQLTRLVIAHRPETIAGAQRVVQVKDGQVVEVARVMPPAPRPAAVPDAVPA